MVSQSVELVLELVLHVIKLKVFVHVFALNHIVLDIQDYIITQMSLRLVQESLESNSEDACR